MKANKVSSGHIRANENGNTTVLAVRAFTFMPRNGSDQITYDALIEYEDGKRDYADISPYELHHFDSVPSFGASRHDGENYIGYDFPEFMKAKFGEDYHTYNAKLK